MTIYGLHLDIVFIFFIYGLAFFTMGVALVLETMRAPALAERRVLHPLAVFGMLHGIHEWMEIILLQGVWLGLPFPAELNWLRVGLLALSFIPLVIFGLLMLPLNGWKFAASLAGFAIVYGLLLTLYAQTAGAVSWGIADPLTRYALAVPGGVLAGLGLNTRARQFKHSKKINLARRFRWAALGFVVYGTTQIFVSPMDFFPASLINSELFTSIFGFPVQLVRAGMALLVTINLILAIRCVDRDREEQLLSAQKARLEALELLQRDLQEREILRRDLLRHTVTAQEEERARIARELHDETAQFLTALSLTLATLRNSLPIGHEGRRLIDRMQEMTRQMSQGIYRLVHDLRPAQLDDLGLVAALQYLADEHRRRTGLEISLNINGSLHRLDPLVETVLFRVAQESLNNVSRHAQCDQAAVSLTYAAEQVILEIRDRGVGINGSEKQSNGSGRGWGLEGMRERVESVGGNFTIHSPPDGGTLVRAEIPLRPSERGEVKEVEDEHHPVDAG